VARLLRKGGAFHVSALSDYEVRKTLLTSGFSEAKLSQLDDLIAARFHLNADWDRAIRKALELARQFRARLVVDSADTLHVAWAMVLGAETFASFDRTKGPRGLRGYESAQKAPPMSEQTAPKKVGLSTCA